MRSLLWMHDPFSARHFEEVYELERLRATVRRELEAHPSVSSLARELAMAPGTLRGFLAGARPQLLIKLDMLKWARRRSSWWDSPGLLVPNGIIALSAAAECFPGPQRRSERNALVRRLAASYRDRRQPVPEWVKER